MHPESKAILLAGALIGVLTLVIWRWGVPFVIESPGPTFNVLGNNDAGQPIVQIDGTTSFPDNGTLRMVTVSVTSPQQTMSLPQAMLSWLTPGNALFPYADYYQNSATTADETAQGQIQMVTSQDSAIAAALTELGYTYTQQVGVIYVTPNDPSDGLLKAKDEILAVNGTKITDPQQFTDVLHAYKPGDTVTLEYQRAGKTGKVDIKLGASPDHPSVPWLGIYIGVTYQFPITVTINVDPSIGGPSAGLVLSLAIYDQLTPGSLVGDIPVAGTGTISPDGKVGPIGGIQQKIRAASEAGATLFLVPPDDCADALGAQPVRPITLVKAPTMQSAIDSIKAYVANPNASLPRCTP